MGYAGVMDANTLRAALRDIGLALNACHNTITTDDPEAEANEHSWRIDHTHEIALVHALEQELLSSTDNAPECADHNSVPLS